MSGPTGRIEVRAAGTGTPVVMVASLGRSARDFDELAARVASAGYLAVAPEPRGIGGTEGRTKQIDLRDLADDVAAVIERHGSPAYVLGHAFGNRVARLTATRHPTLVAGVVLLGCGGAVLPEPSDGQALLAVFDESLDSEQHLDAVRRAFFAPGNDPAAWRDGWYPSVADIQRASMVGVPTGEWWDSGDVDVLVIQAAQDVIAPPANGVQLMSDLGKRGELVVVDDAGHAMLPEQPVRLAEAITGWLARRSVLLPPPPHRKDPS